MTGEQLSKKLSNAVDSVSHSELFWTGCRLAISLLCFCGCLYQCTVILSLYFQYPEDVAVTVEANGKLDFPGITLCSTVGIRKTMLETMPGYSEGLSSVNGSEGGRNKSAIQSKMDEFYRQYLDTHTMGQLVTNGLNYSEFIDMNYTKCAVDEQFKKSSCKSIPRLETFQGNQMCFTMYHESDKSEGRKEVPRSGIATSAVVVGNNVINIEESERPMQPNEVIRFLVNFRLNEATNLNEPPSGRVIVHDPKDIPAVRLSSMYIQAGNYYEIYMSEQVSELLPAPFASNCTDYLKRNSGSYMNVSQGEIPHVFFQKPLSRSSCYMGCLGKETVKSCGCWPPEIPYLPVEMRKGNSKAKLCNWLKSSQKLHDTKPKKENETAQEADNSNAIGRFKDCLVRHESYCKELCPQDCVQKRYFTTVQSYEWPSDERINFSSNAARLKELRECCAIVSIRYYTDEATKYVSSPKYDIIEFFSYIGGIVSLWLGFTFIGIYDYIKDSHGWVKERMDRENGLRSTVVKSVVRMKRMATAKQNKLLANGRNGYHGNNGRRSVMPLEWAEASPGPFRSGRRTVQERYPWIYSKPSYIKPADMVDWRDYYHQGQGYNHQGQGYNHQGQHALAVNHQPRPTSRSTSRPSSDVEIIPPIQRKLLGNPSYVSSYRFQ